MQNSLLYYVNKTIGWGEGEGDQYNKPVRPVSRTARTVQ